MTKLTKTLVIAGTAVAIAVPVGAAQPAEYIPGVTDFPSANRTERFVPGVSDFPSVNRTGTSYHTVVRGAPEPTASPVASGDGFRWADAGIGAAVGAVLSALLLGSTLVLRRRVTELHA